MFRSWSGFPPRVSRVLPRRATRPDRSGFLLWVLWDHDEGMRMTAIRERSLVREPALWQAVGNTPLLPVELPGGQGRFWLKAEWMNPGGSVKDRTARSILRDAFSRGLLPGRRLLDASSGNTGIA